MSHAAVVADPAAVCSVPVEHRPRPLRLVHHHVLPEVCGGTETKIVCDLCHYAAHELLYYAAKHDGALPPRRGNPGQRALALAGYAAAVQAGTVALIPDEGNIS